MAGKFPLLAGWRLSLGLKVARQAIRLSQICVTPDALCPSVIPFGVSTPWLIGP